MDFLESLDLDVPKYKKSRRVRSWYLYEQFKSLERNQLDAARKLKNRSHQEKILRQELCERKVRRNLYDQSLSQSESAIESSIESTKTLNTSTDDFFESFHELQNEGLGKEVDQDDAYSINNSETEKFYDDDFKSIDAPKDDQSFVGSTDSVVNVKPEENLIEDLNKILEIEKENKFNNNTEFNFDAVKEKLQCLERLAQIRDLEKFSGNEGSLHSIEENELKQKNIKDRNMSDNNINMMWSKLVSFAYQIMQLHHGNCYYDYGSQLLTAVLACDVLRRGISKMCHILQPYVSPIKFAIDSEISEESHKYPKRNKYPTTKPTTKNHQYELHHPYRRRLKNLRRKLHASSRMNRSENLWKQRSCPFSVEKINKMKVKKRSGVTGASDPGRRNSMLAMNKGNTVSKSSYHTIWPRGGHSSNDSVCIETCPCCYNKVVNPMLHLSQYLDEIIRDSGDPLFYKNSM